MVFKDKEAGLPYGGHDRRKLRQDIDAVLVLLHHALHAARLPLDPAQARLDFRFVRSVGSFRLWFVLVDGNDSR